MIHVYGMLGADRAKSITELWIPHLGKADVEWSNCESTLHGFCRKRSQYPSNPCTVADALTNSWYSFTDEPKFSSFVFVSLSLQVTRNKLKVYLLESFHGMLPAPSIIIDFMSPLIVICLRSPRIGAEVDRSAPTQTLTSTVNEFSALELFLRNSLVGPIITWRCYPSPIPCAKALVFEIGILASSLDQQDFALR